MNPEQIVISRTNMHDVNILDKFVLEAGAIYIVDQAYLDYARLYLITMSIEPSVSLPTKPRSLLKLPLGTVCTCLKDVDNGRRRAMPRSGRVGASWQVLYSRNA